jgi:hypothetical protein
MQRKTTYPPRFALAALLTALGTALVALGQRLGSLGARVAPTGDTTDDTIDAIDAIGALDAIGARIYGLDAIDGDAEDYAEDTNDEDIPGMKHPVVRVPVEGTDNDETPRDPGETRYYDETPRDRGNREHRPTPGETGDTTARSEGETSNSQELRGMGGYTIGTTGPSGTWFEEVYSLEDAEFGPFVDTGPHSLNLQAVRVLEPSSDTTPRQRWVGPTVDWDPPRKSVTELADEIQALENRMKAQGLSSLNLQATMPSEPSSDRDPVMSGVPDLYDGLTGPVDDIGGRDA